MTVQGPVGIDELGVTLMHEHILNDVRSWWHEPTTESRRPLAEGPVRPQILGELRMDPFVNKHNLALDDEDLAIEELLAFVGEGGRTVVDPTCRGIGRDPVALTRIAKATGLQIVMGAGHYLEGSHPDEVKLMDAGAIADQLVREATRGVDDGPSRIGLIGEIGVSADFTEAEEKCLRGAAQGARRTGLPLMVHLPGWERHAHKVLDIVEEEGADPHHTVLCHMNPSLEDVAYQSGLAERGAFLEYDMIGMDYYYADQDAQCPSDADNARAIRRLIDMGYGDSLLLSQDVFLKMMLTRYGGFGYAYVLRHFVPRLRRVGVPAQQIEAMLTDNPKRVFSARLRAEGGKR
ncbi:phosphotriesterase family protein [Marinivivus vitaminiproducens]|uniref:phosphotriesterase family protein n=1 Tax=Marinivivus vitaminiproducens TaxID=3035935 RepID=UPI003FA0A373